MRNVDQTLERALGNLGRLQAERGSWPSDYGGPMFLLPMWVALAYVAKRLPDAKRIERLLTYFTNVQRADGSIGLHAESSSGSMFTSVLSYVAMLCGARRSVWPASTAQPTSPLLVVAMPPNPLVCSRQSTSSTLNKPCPNRCEDFSRGVVRDGGGRRV